MYEILIRDGIFIDEYRNPDKTECRYCGLSFAHLHKKESNLIGFTKVTEHSWEERFDKEFPFGSFAGSSVRANEVKDFIRREFI